jgi:predicted aspartyl protease
LSQRLVFDGRFILVRGQVVGPTGEARIDFALDTGSTRTVISRRILERVGITVDPARPSIRLVTASGPVETVAATATELRALGRQGRNFSVLAFELPRAARVDGLLGLDFLRGHRLLIDFRAGTIALD